jgi:hypothetical protein
MTDERIIRLQAAFSKIKPLSALLRAAAKDMKALRVAANVWASKDWEDKVFGDAKKLFDAAAEGKFEQDDLDFCKGPDYKPGEKRLRDAHKKE